MKWVTNEPIADDAQANDGTHKKNCNASQRNIAAYFTAIGL